MTDLEQLREDLMAEQHALDDIMSAVSADQWHVGTPSVGWDVGDQIGHLTYFDGTAALAIEDPDAFSTGMKDLIAAASGDGIDHFTLGTFRALPPIERMELWRMNRARLGAASADLHDETRVPWYGPSMSAKSFLTARLMEVWAHGTDICDAIGAARIATNRLRHIAQLGFITRSWSYSVRGLSAPDAPVFVRLTGPDGAQWQWGPSDATELISGPAEDFCLVVTQRRHLDDTALETTPVARDWMLHAQAFAGGPTAGPAPKVK